MLGVVLTFLVEPGGQLLPLLKVWPGQHLQHLLDAAPAGPGQDLGQTDAERGVAAVHVADVVGGLDGHRQTQSFV